MSGKLVGMIVYSNNIVRFIEEIKFAVKETLSKKVGLKVVGNRFYDKDQKYSYPIKVVIFNNKKLLGYYDPEFYEMGFHECLMQGSREQLLHVIRHEVAHYMTHISFGPHTQPHGSEFKAFCLKMGWGEEVSRATLCFEEEGADFIGVKSALFRKIEKLMALSTSSNSFEAEQALLKSQELVLKHNIDTTFVTGQPEEQMHLKRIIKERRETAKMRCIARILETFFVSVIFNRGQEYTYLEVLGEEANIEIAEYVAGFLDNELESLWNQAQKKTGIKGATAKNSFFLGLAKGYCEKIQALKRSFKPETSKALLVIEKKLADSVSMAYPRLSTSRSTANFCPESSLLGEKMGKNLNIHPSLHQPAKTVKQLIGFSGN